MLKKPVGKLEATATYTAVIDGTKYQYYIRVIDVSGSKVRFVGWAPKDAYNKYRTTFKKCAGTLKGW